MHPATDYVREFTQDIPKAKVLTARDVMTPYAEGAPVVERHTVNADDTVETLVRSLLTEPEPLTVVDGDADRRVAIGVVDRAAVVALLGANP
jgi:glycine betaine/proline transport system ATP-binding protein